MTCCLRRLTQCVCTDLQHDCYPSNNVKPQGEFPPPKRKEHSSNIGMKESKTSNSRRVIFPALHQSTSTLDTDKLQAEPKSRYHGRVSSLDSISGLEVKRNMIPFSPRLKEQDDCKNGSSPVCVSALKQDACLPLQILSSPPLYDFEPSTLCIPPFKQTITPPEDVNRQVDRVLIDKHTFTKKMESSGYQSSFLTGFPGMKQPQGNVPKLPLSILRNKSIESIPSVVSLATSEKSCESKRVQFDARVWVCEFSRQEEEFKNTWYSKMEMDKFKRRAMECVCTGTIEYLPTGTGRQVRVPRQRTMLYSNPALFADEDEDEVALQCIARLEFLNILILDPHDLCCSLFAKALKHILPHANIVTAKTSDEVLSRMEQLGAQKTFDLFLVEERLKLIQEGEDYQSSGSALIRFLRNRCSKVVPQNRQPLFIGVSAHFGKDKETLQKSGASLCWPKPPPSLNKVMRDNLLKQILMLRGKRDTALRYFL